MPILQSWQKHGWLMLMIFGFRDQNSIDIIIKLINAIGKIEKGEVWHWWPSKNLKVKKEEHRTTAELEYAKWKETSANPFLNILGVYRPPDGSIPQLLDIFMELLVDIVTSNTNLVVLGNFNIHVNDTDDPNANIVLDTMTALRLKQHVRGPTHKSGNCLDFWFSWKKWVKQRQ